MFQEAIAKLIAKTAVETVSAHCDGPCGVYDPASARIAAEAALSMTKRSLISARQSLPITIPILASSASRNSRRTWPRKELLILWTDYFKPEASGTVPGPARQVLECRQAVFGRQAGRGCGRGQRPDGCHRGYPQRLLGHKGAGCNLLRGDLILGKQSGRRVQTVHKVDREATTGLLTGSGFFVGEREMEGRSPAAAGGKWLCG